MADITEKTFTKDVSFKNIGDEDRMPYSKVDLFKAGRVGGSFALSCYQMDYQAVINTLSGQSRVKEVDSQLIPVTKIVMDLEAFNKLRHEINMLHDNVFKKK